VSKRVALWIHANILFSPYFSIASKWMYRQDSIKSMTAFVESGHLKSSSTIETDASSLLVIVREHTRGFKETNVNIMKAILQLFLSMCDLFESMEKRFLPWAMKAGVEVAIQKISDRKLSSASKGLLTSLCVVSIPKEVLIAGFSTLKGVKSPVAHEEYMRWLLTFCDEFGMASAGNGLPDILPPLLEVRSMVLLRCTDASFIPLLTIRSHHFFNVRKQSTRTSK